MQTNKEFLDALDIRPDDGFLAVTIRRAAALQLGKSVIELETGTVDEPDFILPWDGKQFGYFLEKELDITIPFAEKSFTVLLISIQENHADWFRGPAIKMAMGEWTKIAVEQFLGPIRDEIHCPENWTPFEPEDLRSTAPTTWSDRLPWKPGPDSKTVKQVLLREDGSIGGLKLYPSYGDGGYRAYVPSGCGPSRIVPDRRSTLAE